MSRFGVTTTPRPRTVEDLLPQGVLSRLERLDVVARKIFSGRQHGERRSRRRGQSVDFADHRPYTAGDDLRFVDWNVFARLDALFLKLYLEEEDLSLGIAIDTSASMDWGNPNKLDMARSLAMAIGWIGLCNHNRVSVHGFDGDGIRSLRTLRGKRRASELGKWLLDLEPGAPKVPGDFESSMRSLASTRQGRGLLIVCSDFLEPDGIESGLRFIAGRGDELVCMQLLAPEEIDPVAAGLSGDLRLADVETGGTVEVTVTPALLRAYTKRLDAWCSTLRANCVRRGIGHLTVPTDTSIETVLVEMMRKEGFVR